MAKNYTDTETENAKVATINIAKSSETTDYNQCAKDKLLHLIMDKVDNGSNIDYIVKLSEVYRNIR